MSDDMEPTIDIRASLDWKNPYVTVDAHIPVYIEDNALNDVFTLMRQVREEFAPDFRAAIMDLDRKWPWTPQVVERIPLGVLCTILGDDAEDVTFPIKKIFSQGEEDEYDTRGKTCGDVMEGQPGLVSWVKESLLKRAEDKLDHVDKLGLAALIALTKDQADF